MRAREIKFRAWDKNHKAMLEWDEMQTKADLSVWFAAHLKSVVLMQATGIKDVTGKEIYEGDILKTAFLKSMGEAGKETSVVIWNEYMGGWQISYTGGFGGPASDSLHRFEHEIIGNVAQNRELVPPQDLSK